MKKLIAFLLTATLVSGLIIFSDSSVLQTDSNKIVCKKPIIIVDAGHGGVDGGAVAKDKTVESGINLEIALKQRDLLRLFGYDVVMTRETDVSVHDDDCVTIRQKKNSDLHNRLKLVEQTNCVCFLSIHQNMFSDSKYSGTQVFYGGKNESSKLLAQSVQSSVKTLLQPQNNRVSKKSTKAIYLLYNSEKPSVMVECGFMSNQNELQLIQNSDYQKKLSFSIFCGLIDSKITGV